MDDLLQALQRLRLGAVPAELEAAVSSAFGVQEAGAVQARVDRLLDRVAALLPGRAEPILLSVLLSLEAEDLVELEQPTPSRSLLRLLRSEAERVAAEADRAEERVARDRAEAERAEERAARDRAEQANYYFYRAGIPGLADQLVASDSSSKASVGKGRGRLPFAPTSQAFVECQLGPAWEGAVEAACYFPRDDLDAGRDDPVLPWANESSLRSYVGR